MDGHPPAALARLVILAGGQSRRMGAPKALLEIRGLPMVRWLAERLGPECESVMVSAGEPALAAGLPRVPDRFAGAGPLAGILAGLEATRGPVLAVACDMPLVTRDSVRAILEGLNGHDAAVPVAGGLPEPACAAWSQRAAGPIAAALERGEHRVRDLLDRLDVAWVARPDAGEFKNLNTPDDYRALLDAMR